jgi:RNA polymerase subunit RPABC4/transcription elongation factor Spt4
MAQLKIQRCKVCTSPLPVGIAKCPKCGAEHQFVELKDFAIPIAAK